MCTHGCFVDNAMKQNPSTAMINGADDRHRPEKLQWIMQAGKILGRKVCDVAYITVWDQMNAAATMTTSPTTPERYQDAAAIAASFAEVVVPAEPPDCVAVPAAGGEVVCPGVFVTVSDEDELSPAAVVLAAADEPSDVLVAAEPLPRSLSPRMLVARGKSVAEELQAIQTPQALPTAPPKSEPSHLKSVPRSATQSTGLTHRGRRAPQRRAPHHGQ